MRGMLPTNSPHALERGCHLTPYHGLTFSPERPMNRRIPPLQKLAFFVHLANIPSIQRLVSTWL